MPSGCDLASAVASARVSQGNSGKIADSRRRSVMRLVMLLRRKILHGLRVVVGLADFRCATGRSELCEEVRVDLGVLAPLLGNVVLVVDRLDRADRLAGTTVDAFVGVDEQHP